MRIIVCVKQICQVYARSGMDPRSWFVAPEDKVYRVNPFDEAALQLAAKVKGALARTEIRLLTLGPLIAEAELRRGVAMAGADELIQLVSQTAPDPWAKSLILARAVKMIGADLVLCGKEALDTRHGQVGAFLARHLEVPFVSSIKNLEISPDGATAKVERSARKGVGEIWESPVPAVFSVDIGRDALPYPSNEAKKRAEALPLRIRSFSDEPVPLTTHLGIEPPRPRPIKIPAPDSSLPAFERVGQLFLGSRIEKKGLILSGTPESQVEGIVSFLRDHSLLK